MSQLHLRDLRKHHPGGWQDISAEEAAGIAKSLEGLMPSQSELSSGGGDWMAELPSIGVRFLQI